MFHAAFHFRTLGLCLALVGSTACARGHAGNEGPARDPDSDLVILHVTNAYKLNVVVYNVLHGARDRIGEVTSVSSAEFRLHLRRLVANEVQFYADPIGAPRGVTSEAVRLTAGDRVEWTLEYDLSRSHLEIH